MSDQSICANPDLHSSTESYARRFDGAIGEWMLGVQAGVTEKFLGQSAPSRVVDIGGGHGQNIATVLKVGAELRVLGSHADCGRRIRTGWQENQGVFFDVGDLVQTPYVDRQFDVAVSYRILAHIDDWPALVRELCRIADKEVIVDYPVWRSFNLLSKATFRFKHSLEKNTRQFRIFSERELVAAFAKQGFSQVGRAPQFFWPMALHRLHRRPFLAHWLEAVPSLVGGTALFGSPVIGCFRRRRESS